MSYGACDDVASDDLIAAYNGAVAPRTGEGALTCAFCGKRYPLDDTYCCDAMEAAVKAATQQPPTSILTEAASLISGERRDAYGTVNESFARVARTWTDILKAPVTPQQVALCMIALKLHREAHASKRDNRVDIAGYAALLDQLYEK